MKTQLETILGWTVIRGKRDLKRFERENFISYCAQPANGFPCLAKGEITGDENSQTTILETRELEAMLSILKKS